jgi:uncharacterized protein YbjT (DUF2867 family)
MKIVIVGGSGLVGSKTAARLRQGGREVVAASPATGVDVITGAGLAESLKDAQIVMDVTNSPSFNDDEARQFFEISGRNLLAAEAAAGVGHHIALSIVGLDRILESGYARAKMAQENLVEAARIPYTIVRSTQFFEYLPAIAQASAVGETIPLSPALVQPIAADDIAAVLADRALAAPANGTVEVAGPEQFSLADVVERFLSARRDARKVIRDVHARYFGAELNDRSLLPGDAPTIGPTHFADWLRAL